ncbi:ferritin family protein [Anaerotalea alkaliphila]|uniref:Ferritin family protein n=1 Tax=Anaerotalea alkaliphila TaxID=2662126 RepID=A0A7X5KM58_9FIRM|nr:ferritin family protein [Anaerotalea alkaliphila]NDL66614.1 ferritin family protein [Anaerotalea alkaliphila]
MQEVLLYEDILNVLVELEKAGQAHYLQLADKTPDPSLKELFQLLARQEKRHQAIYEDYRKTNVHFKREAVTGEYKAYMDALLQGTMAFLRTEESFTEYARGFDTAVGLEKDTLLFLSELKKLVDPPMHPGIDQLMDEERKHLEYLYTRRP